MPALPDPDWRDIQTVRVNGDSDGDNEIVAAVTGKKIRVVAFILSTTTTGLVSVKSGSTVKAEISFTAAQPVPFAGGPHAPAFETAIGEALVLTTQASQDVNGSLAYMLV